MTDINEIIGRALLTLNDKHGAGNPFVGYDGRSDDVTLDGHFLFTDIGAAVVKALGEAGYKIVDRNDIADRIADALRDADERSF